MNKSKISYFLTMFSIMVTAILIVSSIYIYCFRGMAYVLNVKYVWSVLGLSLGLSLGYLPFLSDLSRRAYVIWNIVYFFIADFIVLLVGFIQGWFSLARPSTIIGMEITFVLVYVIVWIVILISMKNSTQKLNDQLKKIQGN